MLDEGGVHLEEISRLQGAISACKGHLTRRYNDIRSSFANNATVTEIMIKTNSLDEIFMRYSSAVESLLHILVDVEEKERVARTYQSELDVRCLFHKEFAGRIRSIQKPASPSVEPTPTPTPLEKPLELPRVTGPNTSGKTTYPCSSSSASIVTKASQAKLAVAQLKMKRLKKQQRLKEKQLELEKERFRVDTEMELLNARSDAEQAKIELSLVNVGSEGLADKPANLVDLPIQTLQETVGKYFESRDNEIPRISPRHSSSLKEYYLFSSFRTLP